MPTVSPGLPTGKVIGRFLFMSQDQDDAGSEPDYLNVTGTVKFTCSANGPLQVASMNLVLIPLVFEATFDSEGYLIPVGDPTLTRGIQLPASSSSVYNPHDFTWKVSFDIRDTRTGLIIHVDPFNVYVTEGVDNDISTQVPVTGSGGVPIVRGETGPAGPYTDIVMGTVTTGTPGAAASASLTGPPGSKSLNVTLPQGMPGDVSAWKTGVPYVVNQVIANPSGDMVKCITAHTSGASYDASKFLQINKGLNDALYSPTIPMPYGWKAQSDDVNAYPAGVTAFISDPSAGWGDYYQIITSKNSLTMTGGTLQMAVPYLDDTLPLRWRVWKYNGTVWGAWQTMSTAASLTAHTNRTDNPHAVTKTQVGLSNVDNTSDVSKPVSTATQTALNAKAPLASPAFTGTPTGITKAHVGLSNVDNTADSAKPISTAQQTALDAKAPLASPAFTGTPTGITKTHVGLGNVDNTSDVNKPVSTAQQTALDKLAKGQVAQTVTSGTTSGITGTAVVADLVVANLVAGRRYTARYRYGCDCATANTPMALNLVKSATSDATTTGTAVEDGATLWTAATASSGFTITHHWSWVAPTTETVNLKVTLSKVFGANNINISGRKLLLIDEGAQF